MGRRSQAQPARCGGGRKERRQIWLTRNVREKAARGRRGRSRSDQKRGKKGAKKCLFGAGRGKMKVILGCFRRILAGKVGEKREFARAV
jgi:hypothetical protein